MPLPVSAFVGLNGHGKTLMAMELVVKPALDSGRRVISTCKVNHPLYSPLESWRQCMDLTDCVLFLDEVSALLPARNAMSAPAGLISMIKQMRKREVEVCWTSPTWADADKALRGVTQSVTVCRGFLGDKYVRTDDIPPWYNLYGVRKLDSVGRPIRHQKRWPSNTVFRAKTYAAVGFEEFSNYAVRDVRPLERMWYVASWHKTRWLYDTYGGVDLLDAVDDVGACIHCGGYRKRRMCTCSLTTRSIGATMEPDGGVDAL